MAVTLQSASSSPTTTPLHLPPELWLPILLHLSPTDLLSLKLSSRPFHALLTALAPHTCNHLILTHFATEAAILGTVMHADTNWLVPTHPCIADEEARAAGWQKQNGSQRSFASSGSSEGESFNFSFDRSLGFGSGSISRSSSSSSSLDRGPRNPRIVTKLSLPGPHYLQFLREYSLEIRIYYSLFLSLDSPSNPPPPHSHSHPSSTNSGSHRRQQRHHSRTAAEILAAQNRRPQPDVFREKVGLYCVRRFLNRLDRVAGGKGNGLQLGENEEGLVRGLREGVEWFYV